MTSTCTNCHRSLKNPDSIRVGYGPVCASRLAVETDSGQLDLFLSRMIPRADWERIKAIDPVIVHCDIHNQVRINGKVLSIAPSRALRNHSQAFSWGYAGSGPSQLALGILYQVTGSAAASLAALSIVQVGIRLEMGP